MSHQITRKQFMKTVAGSAALTAMTSSEVMAAALAPGNFSGKPQRGVSIFSYRGAFGVSMTLEDCFADMYDRGAEGLEILAKGRIPGYPDVQWSSLTPAILQIKKPGGLPTGIHDVEVQVTYSTSYLPPRLDLGFPGREPYKRRMTLVR